MVWVTRLDGTRFAVNPDLIEFAEETPDTVLTLTNGHHFVVREPVEELINLIAGFRRRTFVPLDERTREEQRAD